MSDADIAYIAGTPFVPVMRMPTLTIRNVDAAVKQKLRMRAARHGRSIEAELREILKEAVTDDAAVERELNLADAIRRRILPLGGLDDLEPHPPVPASEPPDFN